MKNHFPINLRKSALYKQNKTKQNHKNADKTKTNKKTDKTKSQKYKNSRSQLTASDLDCRIGTLTLEHEAPVGDVAEEALARTAHLVRPIQAVGEAVATT